MNSLNDSRVLIIEKNSSSEIVTKLKDKLRICDNHHKIERINYINIKLIGFWKKFKRKRNESIEEEEKKEYNLSLVYSIMNVLYRKQLNKLTSLYTIILILLSNSILFQSNLMKFKSKQKDFLYRRRGFREKSSYNFPSIPLFIYLFLIIISSVLICNQNKKLNSIIISVQAEITTESSNNIISSFSESSKDILNEENNNQDTYLRTFQQASNDDFNNQQIEPNEPIFMALQDSGSGYGYPPIFTTQPNDINNFGSSGQDFEGSSSVSPSLIAAKCWNNDENINDCRNLNVITANKEDRQEIKPDDSLITTVVIFESSSSLPPTPFTDQKEKSANENDQYVPTQTQTGATILPDLNWPRVRWGPRVGSISFGSSTNEPDSIKETTTKSSETSETPTRRPFNLFVATQHTIIKSNRPKCVSETDQDCDDSDESDNKMKVSSDADDDEDDESKEDDEEEEDEKNNETDSDTDNDIDSKYINKINSSTNSNDEQGSGLSPQDDNEDDGDYSENQDENSGDGENKQYSTKGYLDITSSSSSSSFVPNTNQPQRSKPNQQSTTISTTTAEATIDVLVHPTLPPSFPMITTQSAKTDDTTTQTTTTTTTMMPDDTFRITPVYPNTTDSPDEDGTTNKEEEPKGLLPTELNSDRRTDLVTFKAMPLPSIDEANINNKPLRDRVKTNIIRQNFWETARPSASGLFETTLRPWLQASKPHQVQPDQSGVAGQSSMQQIPIRQGPIPQSTDNYPTVIIYSMIGCLSIIAFILMVMMFGLWRKTVDRSRALIQKAHMMNNGMMGPPTNHLSPGNDGCQLVANLMPPGLLNTYGLGPKGQVGKVANTVVKTSDRAQMIEDDELQMIASNEEQQSALSRGEGSFGDSNLGIASRDQHPDTNNSSWTTEERTTSSGESQTSKMISMDQQPIGGMMHQQKPQMQQHINSNQQQRMLQFSSDRAGSDGIQNSGSMTDSQESQNDIVHAEFQPPVSANHDMAQFKTHNVPIYQHQREPYQVNGSRSVEDLQQTSGSSFMMIPPHQQVVPPNLQQTNYIEQRAMNDPGFKGPYHQTPNQIHEANFIPINGMMQPVVGFPRVNIVNRQPMLGRQDTGALDYLESQFQRQISPARVAMNPLATLGRRYPGMGLNRNILSEDTSSSLMTASPSLARTSSSSSFALMNQRLL